MFPIQLTARQEQIIEIVRQQAPITGERIAELLHVRRATLRPDLTVLTMAGLLEARPRVGYFCGSMVGGRLALDELRRLTVKEVMAVPVSVTGGTTVYDVIVTMFTEDVGTIYIITADGYLEGAVSRKDILKAALGQVELHKIPVSVVMTRIPNVVSVTGDEPVIEAGAKLVEHQYDSMPVVELVEEEQGKAQLKVIGRFTKTTIARLFVEMGEVR